MASLYDQYKQEKTQRTSASTTGGGSLYSRFQQEQVRSKEEARLKEASSKIKTTEPVTIKQTPNKSPITLAAPDKTGTEELFASTETSRGIDPKTLAQDKEFKKTVKNVAGSVVKQTVEPIVKKLFLPNINLPNVPFLEATPEQYGQAVSDSVKQGAAQYSRLSGRLRDFASVYSSEIDNAEKAKRSLDAASSVLIDGGGAIFNGALNVIGATPAGKIGLENFGKVLGGTMDIAGEAASKGLKALPVNEDFKRRLDPSVREFAGAVAVALLFKAAHSSGKAINAKLDNVRGFKTVLGIDPNKPITPESVANAYRLQSEAAISSGNLDKTDILNGVKPIVDEIARVGEVNWNPETSPAMRAVNQAVDIASDTLKADSDTLATTAKAEIVEGIINKPLSSETVAMRKALDSDMQFAFENEIYDLNAKNDIDLAKKTGEEAINFERINDPLDGRVGYFDAQTRTIRINEDRIQSLVDTLADGKKALKISDGRLVTSFSKKADESLAELKKRLEQTIIRHETAHAKTISPEDVARMRAASELNDAPTIRKIRSEMEGKADRYAIENASKLLDDSLVKDINRATEASYARDQIKMQMDSLKFANDEMNSAYDQYRKLVSKNDKYYLAGEEAFRNQMRESPKYRNLTDAEFRQKWEGAMYRGQDGSGFSRIDDLFDVLRRRFDAEKKLKKEYDDLKKSQRDLFAGKERLDDRVRRAMRDAIKAERASEKTRKERASFDKGRMFENIRGKVEKDIIRERMKTTVGKVRERYQKRYLRTQLNDLLKRSLPKRSRGGRLSGRFTPETQQFLMDVYRNRKGNRSEALSRAMEAINAWRKQNPDIQEIPENLFRDLKLAEATGYLRQDVKALQETIAAIRDMKGEAIAARQARRERNIQIAEKIKENIKETLTGETGFEIDPIKKVEVQKTMKEGLKSWWYGTKPFNSLVDPLGREFRELAKKISNQADRVKNEYGRAHDEVVEVMEREYGMKWQDEKSDKMQVQKELGNFVDANGKTRVLRASRLNAMDIYARLKDKKFNDNLYHENGNAFTKEMTEAIISSLTDSDKRVMDHIVNKIYKGQYARFAEAFEKASGVRLGYVENYAGPMRYVDDIKLQKDIEKGEDLVDVSLADYATRKGMSVQGGASRTGHIGQMRFSDDPIRDALEYKRSTEHFIQMNEYVGTLDRIMSDKNVIGAMENGFGRDYVQNVRLHAEDIRQGGIVKSGNIKLNRIVSAIQGSVSKALIQNPSVWAGQWADIATFKAEAKNASAFNKGLLHWKDIQPLLEKYAPSVEARVRKTESSLMERVEGQKSKVGRVIEKIGDAGTVPIEWNDRQATKRGAAGLFNDRVEFYKKLGETQETAYKRAGRDVGIFIKDSLSTPDYLGKANIEKRPGLGQVVVALRNQPNKTFHRLWTKVAQYKRGDITGRELGHFIYWNNIVQPTMYYGLRTAVKQSIRGAKAAVLRVAGADTAAEREEKRLKEEKYSRGIAFSIVNNAFSGFVLGDIIQTVVLENMIGGKDYELRPSVLSAAEEDIIGGINELRQNDLGSAMAKTSRGVLRSVGIGDPLDVFGSILAETARVEKMRKEKQKKK